MSADFLKFRSCGGDAAAGAAQRIGGAHDDGIAHLIRKLQRVVDVIDYHACDARFAQFQHRILERLPVFRLVDGVGFRAQKFYVVFFEDAALV